MNKFTKSLALLMPLTVLSHATLYESAEDGTIERWRIVDNTPSGASISNITQENNRVISLSGYKSDNAFILGGKNDETQYRWDDRSENKVLNLKMKFDSRYYLYVYVTTESGEISRIRLSSSRDEGIKRSDLRVSLGSESDDGEWVELSIDLEQEIQKYRPNDKIISINGMMVLGSGLIDDVRYGDSLNSSNGNGNSNHNNGFTLYENGESIDAWRQYPHSDIGNTLSVEDNAIRFNQKGIFILGGTAQEPTQQWNNRSQTELSLDMKFNKRYYLYVLIETESGEINRIRLSSSSDEGVKRSDLRISLGRESDDGEWVNLSMDLDKELKKVRPDDKIIAVHGMLVETTDTGGLIDSIQLSGETATPRATPAPSATPTSTPVPRVTPTPTPAPSATPTSTPVPRVTPTPTSAPIVTPTPTPTPAPTSTPDNETILDSIDEAINSEASILTQELQDSIAYMYSEEKLAKEVYLNLYAVQAVKQLYNIATNSEINHVDAVNRLAIKYDLNTTYYPDTQVPYDADTLSHYGNGQFPVVAIQELYDMLYDKGIQSEQDALEVGCMVEVTDVTDLDEYIEEANSANAPDVLTVFDYLRSGSYSHYWAFDSGLKQKGISEGCCSLGEAYCHPEYPTK